MAASHFSAHFFEGAKGKPETRDKQSTESCVWCTWQAKYEKLCLMHVTSGVEVAILSARDAKIVSSYIRYTWRCVYCRSSYIRYTRHCVYNRVSIAGAWYTLWQKDHQEFDLKLVIAVLVLVLTLDLGLRMEKTLLVAGSYSAQLPQWRLLL